MMDLDVAIDAVARTYEISRGQLLNTRRRGYPFTPARACLVFVLVQRGWTATGVIKATGMFDCIRSLTKAKIWHGRYSHFRIMCHLALKRIDNHNTEADQ